MLVIGLNGKLSLLNCGSSGFHTECTYQHNIVNVLTVVPTVVFGGANNQTIQPKAAQGVAVQVASSQACSEHFWKAVELISLGVNLCEGQVHMSSLLKQQSGAHMYIETGFTQKKNSIPNRPKPCKPLQVFGSKVGYSDAGKHTNTLYYNDKDCKLSHPKTSVQEQN